MTNKLIIVFLTVLLVACDKDPGPNITPTPDPPNPKMLCIVDDSLPRFKYNNIPTFRDTNDRSVKATLNYDLNYVGQAKLIPENNGLVNLVSYQYFRNDENCFMSFLLFQRIQLCKDTIYLNNSFGRNYPVFSFVDCDQPSLNYKLDSSKNNFLLFKQIDTVNRFLIGEFWCQLYFDRSSSSFDTKVNLLRFCDGQFRLKY